MKDRIQPHQTPRYISDRQLCNAEIAAAVERGDFGDADSIMLARREYEQRRQVQAEQQQEVA